MDNYGVRVLADFVLVKQVMRKKKTAIIMDAAESDKDRFDYSFEVVQKGEECKRNINIGDSPIFSEYVKFSGVKILEKDENGMVSVVIVHENDIIGVDLEPKKQTPNASKN
jgi:hypothetical protein